MKEDYRICTRCIMDTTDPDISFNEDGVCNYCEKYDFLSSTYCYRPGESEKELEAIVNKIKADGEGKEYDVILGISGGVDSAYLAYLAHNLGLRVLAVHVDAGWNSDVAVSNIQKLCKALEFDLHTIVMDWPTMKELQRAYMFSGLPNLDVPQDHAFLTNVFKYAKANKIKYMLNGSNLNTEGTLPRAWGYDPMDAASLKSVYKKCGRGKSLKKYPMTNSIKHFFIHRYVIKRVNLLNFVNYTKSGAIKLLSEKFGWVYYGGKHFESRFTKFFQSYYLPQKFNYNKKRAHLSSLVTSGEMTREEALRQMDDDSAYTMEEMLEDRDYILKKLDITLDEWNGIMAAQNKTEADYRSNKKLYEFFTKIIVRLRLLKKKIKSKR